MTGTSGPYDILQDVTYPVEGYCLSKKSGFTVTTLGTGCNRRLEEWTFFFFPYFFI